MKEIVTLDWKTSIRRSTLLLTVWLWLYSISAMGMQSSVPWTCTDVTSMADAEGIHQGSVGSLTIDTRSLSFTGKVPPKSLILSKIQGKKSKEETITIQASEISNISIGGERKEAGGKIVMVSKSFMPYHSGQILSLVATKHMDLLTIEYQGSHDGYHEALFMLPKEQAAAAQQQLILAGATVRRDAVALPGAPPAPEESSILPPLLLPRSGCAPQATVSAIRIEPSEDGAAALPPEYRAALYEDLIARMKASKRFDHVYRAGDQDIPDGEDVLVLSMRIERFKKGSEVIRASGGSPGGLLGTTKIKAEVRATTCDGSVLLDQEIKGAQRQSGDGLVSSDMLAKAITKTLLKQFPKPDTAVETASK
jgi:hypothetical protein